MSQHPPLSRRELIASAATAAAALAFPTIIPSSALGQAGQPAPSQRLALGVIGLGKQGAGHHLMGKVLGRPDMQVVAVSDVDTFRREHFQQEVDKKYAQLERKGYKGCAAYIDYRELLARGDIDAVLIASPDHWHAAQAIDACKAKKDVYCEKPLTLTIGEAKAVLDAARKHERVFQTGSQQRSEGPFREVAEYVRNGRLGKITEVHVALGGTTSKPCDLPEQQPDPGLDWDRWLGQVAKRPYNEVLSRKGLPDKYPFNPGWRDYREFSGGYVTDWGAHHLDITQWALGTDDSGPVEARPPAKEGAAYGAQLVYRNTPAGDEITVTHVEKIELPAGDNGKARTEPNGILFVGDKGKIFVNRDKGKMWASSPSLVEPLAEGEKVRLAQSPGHHTDWLNCIKSRQRPIADVEIGARSVTTCHLVNLAYWNHRALKWDPKKWEFVGDAEANRWRDRDRRQPYALPVA